MSRIHLNLKINWLSIVLILFFSQGVFSQWFYSLSLDQEYNTNPFRLPEAESDFISVLGGGVQRQWEAASLQYYGSFTGFRENTARNFYWHQLFLSGGDSTGYFLSLENRINGADYSIYNYTIGKAGLNHQLFSRGFFWRMGVSFSLSTYQELAELDNFLLSSYASVNRSFPTRTSVIAAVAFNYKSYLNQTVSATVPGDSVIPVNASVNSLTGINGGGGPGHGMWGDQYYFSREEAPAVAQLLVTLRLAQSLGTYSGVALQYQVRKSFTNQERTLAGISYGYADESQIFDDPLGYEGQSLGIEFNQYLPYGIFLKTNAFLNWKNYISQGIYSDAENYTDAVLREDTFRTAGIFLRKSWNTSVPGLSSLGLQVNYQWMDNSSNSYWYNYRNQYVSTGLQFDW